MAMNRSDDGLHDPVDDPRWRESYYFSFFDFGSRIGGFSSIGRRPSKGYVGSINVVWGPEMPTLVAAELGRSEGHTQPYEVNGLRYEQLEEFGPWQLRFSGPLNDGGDGIECDPAAITTAGGSIANTVDYDLVFRPDHPAYHYEQRPEWTNLFTGHIDEVGVVTGTVTIDGRTYEIHGRGGKDHSWGVRDWYKPQAWRWVDLLTTSGPELATWRANFEGRWVDDGAIFAEGRTDRLERYDETVEDVERARKPLPVRWTVEAASAGHSIAAEGEVVRVVPIVFGRESGTTRETSWNDRVLVRCRTSDGAEAWANVEFEALVAEPAGSQDL